MVYWQVVSDAHVTLEQHVDDDRYYRQRAKPENCRLQNSEGTFETLTSPFPFLRYPDANLSLSPSSFSVRAYLKSTKDLQPNDEERCCFFVSNADTQEKVRYKRHHFRRTAQSQSVECRFSFSLLIFFLTSGN